jgi:hypothetical protein
MNKRLIPLFLSLLIVVGFTDKLAAVAVVPTPDLAQQALTFEKARWEAALHCDVKVLDKMLSADLTYIHAAGYAQTKAEYLAAIASGQLLYHTYSLENRTAKAYGNVAITHGTLRFTVTSKGQELAGAAYYTGVYVFRNGVCRLVSWQTTRIEQP